MSCCGGFNSNHEEFNANHGDGHANHGASVAKHSESICKSCANKLNFNQDEDGEQDTVS